MILDPDSYRDAIPKLEELFERAFRQRIPFGTFQWRYLANPAGDLISCVEREGGRIVASYSASPGCMDLEGREIRAAFTMNAMTDPDHEGRGIYTRLALELEHEMSRRGYDLVFSFPNRPSSHHVFVDKLAMVEVGVIRTRRLGLNGRAGGLPDPGPSDDSFALDYTAVASAPGRLQLRKPVGYLRWRYAEHPSRRYRNLVITEHGRVRSHVVAKRFEDGLDLVDFRPADGADAEALLDRVIGLARKEGLESVSCWAPSDHLIEDLCNELGFAEAEPATHLVAKVLRPDAELEAILARPEHWFLQMGDSDVY